ncbi:hypothetical protein Y032_0266g684 [Ancylostoma ceylanicum]|uniref:Uncharacterized protein n=2 Tax=Ancylostoma ceylanicum TaxID=53326 RepID=A0A016SA90_9BILA|nr:hypothetical protein Y032_0266g684 [Ancylostoma ceylanicum]
MGRLQALLNGPRLYRIFGQPERTTNIVESIGNNSMSLARGLLYFSTSLAFSPIIIVFLYTRGALNIHTGMIFLKYASYLAVLAFGGRLVGRSMDNEYRHFLNIWMRARGSGKSEDNELLKRYDFDLDGVHADFHAVRNENLWYYRGVSAQGTPLLMCAAWYAVHAFGRHMLYPGSLALLNWLLSSNLITARNLMVSAKNGRRAWLRSTEGDLIDTMFIRGEEGTPEHRISTTERNIFKDRVRIVGVSIGKYYQKLQSFLQVLQAEIYERSDVNVFRFANFESINSVGIRLSRHRTLVISCEGNAGYYEIGIANTPAQLGYSVLGWNQPGFGQSSGVPFPNNTLAAADAVMQYAQTVLGFREEDIVLFGWSIGGYPASWLAANYPKVKGVVLDATFDDVLPIAQARMPKILSDIVEYAIRTHFDLNIQAILAQYKGPLKLIRRLQEEILITDETGTEVQRRASNRANILLKRILQQRHPSLIADLDSQVDRWLAMGAQQRAMAGHAANDSEVAIRRARLYAACDHYLTDFDATHVQPLDPGYFNIPVPFRDLK